MKNIFCFGALLIMNLSVLAQNGAELYKFGVEKYPINPNTNPVAIINGRSNVTNDRALNVLWTEDFDGSAALTTANGLWTVAGPEGSYWSLSSSTTTPLGYPNNLDGRHLMWDSRSPVSAMEPSGSFATTPVEGSVISPAIDLTGYTNVTLQFDLNGRYCCNAEPWTVSISSDNGTVWGAEIPLSLGLDDNVTTNDIAEPLTFNVNISPYLDPIGANNSDVKLRFTWTGVDANSAGQMSSYYSWEIDDIQLYEIPPYDISQNELWLQNISQDYEYTAFPANQVATLTVQAPIANNGLNTPSNMAMEVTLLYAATGSILAGPVSGGSLASGPIDANEHDTITFATTIDLSALAIGEYRIQSVITYDETDEVPQNDTLVRTFRVTSSTMGHINYDANPIITYQNVTADNFKTGAMFTLQTDVDLYAFDFFLPEEGATTQETVVDVPVVIWIHDMTDPDNPEEIAYFGFELTSDKLGGWYTFCFDGADYDNSSQSQPVYLLAGKEYAVTMESFANPFWYQSSMADADRSAALYYSGDDTWNWNGNEPWVMLRMGYYGCWSSVADHYIYPSISVSQNQPNPFNNNTIITYSLNSTENVTVTIADVRGIKVAAYFEGSKAKGQHQLEIVGNELTSGIYFYTFTAGNYSVTKRMVVNK